MDAASHAPRGLPEGWRIVKVALKEPGEGYTLHTAVTNRSLKREERRRQRDALGNAQTHGRVKKTEHEKKKSRKASKEKSSAEGAALVASLVRTGAVPTFTFTPVAL